MGRTRRPKRPRLAKPKQEQLPANPAPGAASSHVEEHNEVLRRRSAGLKSQIRKRDFKRRDNENIYDPTVDEIEALMPFCCAVCHCNQDTIAKVPVQDRYCSSTTVEGGYTTPLYHRRCCHGCFNLDDEAWAPLCEVVLDATPGDDEDGSSNKPNGLEWVTLQEIYDAYVQSRKQEAELYNDDRSAEDPSVKIQTSPEYGPAIQEAFQRLVKTVKENPSSCHAVTVLDCFAGVGTGEVVLKRLGIDIRKVVYVEHDLVARHVYRYHHDAAYRDDESSKNNTDADADADVEHIYIEEFEELEQTLQNVSEEHGPFDIVLGGPPCVDFSEVHANRQGVQGEQGQYMLRFGRLIRQLERLQHPHPLFFLAENVVLRGNDRKEVCEAFGFDMDPIELDAKYLSPTRRKRHFITNVPVASVDVSDQMFEMGPSSCLESGFRVPAHVLDSQVIAKAQCFMASTSRVDERNTMRMYVFREKPNPVTGNYHGRPMTCLEREKLMGYPPGYVEEPVNKLFRILRDKALINCYRQSPAWREALPQKYHIFSGNYHKLPCHDPYRFDVFLVEGDFPHGYVKMAPPVTSNAATPSFFLAEEYAKHLIGLAFSVPVVEHLLRPLTQIYPRRVYGNFRYSYAWEVGGGENDDDDDDRKMPGHDSDSDSDSLFADEQVVNNEEGQVDDVCIPIKSSTSCPRGSCPLETRSATEDGISNIDQSQLDGCRDSESRPKGSRPLGPGGLGVDTHGATEDVISNMDQSQLGGCGDNETHPKGSCPIGPGGLGVETRVATEYDISKMDQSQVNGCRDDESHPNGNRPLGPGGLAGFNVLGRDQVKLHVGNLSFETTQDAVKSLFEHYGTVSNCFMPTSRDSGKVRGFCFVTMPAAEAQRARFRLNGYKLDGRTLLVNEAQPKGRSGGSAQGRRGYGGGYDDRNGYDDRGGSNIGFRSIGESRGEYRYASGGGGHRYDDRSRYRGGSGGGYRRGGGYGGYYDDRTGYGGGHGGGYNGAYGGGNDGQGGGAYDRY